MSKWYGIAVSGGRVTGINLYDNRLVGTIPTSLGNLTKLIILNLEHCNISGSIPSSLGNLINLQQLFLYGNLLSGSIPSSLGNLINLQFLDFGHNQLIDSIPSSLGNLVNIKFFELDQNKLSGSIPSSLGNLINDTLLLLNSNQLSGSIPASLGNLTNLRQFFLMDNQFTFAGMEGIVNVAKGCIYYKQATIPLNNISNILSVSVGGTPSKDTFRFYKDGLLVATKVGDSTYRLTSNGKYWVVAKNAVAIQLKLYSDTITITSLPIQDIKLQAKTTNGQVLLQWQTIDEKNTASFTVQYSTDGITFTDIGTKDAKGSGNNGYSFIDKSPIVGFNYYRLKDIDKDGGFEYCKIISVQLTVNNNHLVVFPNPSKDKITISGNHIISIQIIDNMGKETILQTVHDTTNPSININSLSKGIYQVHIQTSDGKSNSLDFVKE